MVDIDWDEVRRIQARNERRDYEAMRELYPFFGLKPWDDLTDEEKEKVRAAERQRYQSLSRLGEAIAEGRVPSMKELESK